MRKTCPRWESSRVHARPRSTQLDRERKLEQSTDAYLTFAQQTHISSQRSKKGFQHFPSLGHTSDKRVRKRVPSHYSQCLERPISIGGETPSSRPKKRSTKPRKAKPATQARNVSIQVLSRPSRPVRSGQRRCSYVRCAVLDPRGQKGYHSSIPC